MKTIREESSDPIFSKSERSFDIAKLAGKTEITQTLIGTGLLFLHL